VSELRHVSPVLNAFIDQQMRTRNTPGLVVALTDSDRLLHINAHGLADVAGGIPVTPDTLFEIGSISKSFTAIALLQLVQEGKVDLQAPVTRYLPWFHVPSHHEPIALHHLLAHTAGLITGSEQSTEARYEVWTLRETEAGGRPGSRFHYSNAGYKALGLVLEALLGQSYREIIQERILRPLGMTSTEPVITHETRKRLAVGYAPFYDDRPSHSSHGLVPATWLETGTADGSIASTAADMSLYLRMLMNRGQHSGGQILSEDGFRLMTQRVVEIPGEKGGLGGSHYGYRLDISEDRGHTLIGHTGGMVGYHAAILADLTDRLGAVVLSNGPGEPAQITRFALQLLRAAHHSETLPPVQSPPDPTHCENAGDYAGAYRADHRSFTLVPAGKQVIMYLGDERVVLEQRGEDRFYVPHPNMDRFLLQFGRANGQVVEAYHGPDWYTDDHYQGATSFDHPPEWIAYPGHYRSHNPWYSNFRVVLRKGALVLIEPWGDEKALVQRDAGLFRVGDDEDSPECLRFDTLIDGQAVRARLSGCDYYRTFTP
jgi:CubicO group peptidase (beta-lactamase class C family)